MLICIITGRDVFSIDGLLGVETVQDIDFLDGQMGNWGILDRCARIRRLQGYQEVRRIC